MSFSAKKFILDKVRRKASHMAFNSALYNWSLSGKAPDELQLVPIETWPGDAGRGRWMLNGAWQYNGDQISCDPLNWEPFDTNEAWLFHMHSFDWLRDLKAMGGDMGRRQTRKMVENWTQHYPSWDKHAWRPDILGTRIANWIACYNFFCASADDSFHELFFDSLNRQARHLKRAMPGKLSGIRLLRAIRGLCYSGISLEDGKDRLELALDLLDKELPKQILADGGHISRGPASLMEAIRICIDIQSALSKGRYPVPEKLQHALDRSIPALRFFTHGDKKLALFNGTQEEECALIDMLLKHNNTRGRGLKSLPNSGFERMAQGRSVLIMDVGKPPVTEFDAHGHAETLSFEFSVGRERIFVNCGTHYTDENWRDALRATAAHNTLTLDNRNSSEILTSGHIGRKPNQITLDRQDTQGACLIDATHNGYAPLNGYIHRRRLFLSNMGQDLRGEENLYNDLPPVEKIDYSVRFHLHPRVQISLVQNGTEALMRLPSGSGWRFQAMGGQLSLENSIYMGEGCRPRKTKQIVISGTLRDNVKIIKWALQKE